MSKKSKRKLDAPPRQPVDTSARRRALLIAVALVVLVFAVFGRTLADRFIYFDDDYYVTLNPHVQNGLTVDDLVWAVSTSDYFYWHPVTWISHMLDCDFYGLNPAGHHFTNTAIHAATVVMVFFAFFYMTGALWRSAFLAALFAVHPLRVESVAWIAERKDVLAGFFWFSTILAYAWYARRPSWKRYAAVAACFALGLMSKPTTVTLPFALLLLDLWPLERFRTVPFPRLLTEKAPLLLLSVASSIVTYIGQKQMGATNAEAHVQLSGRLANSIVSYAKYIGKTFWPHPLAILYPYDTNIPITAVAAAVALLLAITVAAILLRHRAPFALTGWFWFAGALVPMIGIVQVGAQAMADRFSYIPSVGLLLILVWGGWRILENRAHAREIAIALAAVFIPTLAIAASFDAGYWKDSTTLLSHAVKVTKNNPIAQHNLGFSLASDGHIEEAIPHYRESLRLEPHDAKAYYNLGLALANLHRPEEAAENFAEAARQWPTYAEAQYSLGATLLEIHRPQEARTALQAAIQLSLATEYAAQAHYRLGIIAAQTGDLITARDELREALRLKPDFQPARDTLAHVMGQLGQSQSGQSQSRQSTEAK